MPSADQVAIALRSQTPVAKGFEHHIYAHPSNEAWLLKIPVSRHGNSDNPPPQRPLDPLRKISRKRALRLEMAYCARMSSDPQAMPPIPRYFGSVTTDMGTAHILERITLPGRDIGPRLGQIAARDALGPKRIGYLNAFVEAMEVYRVPARDLLPRNLVLGDRGRGPEFVLVDGFGDHGIIHIRSRIGFLRRRRTDSGFADMATKLGLHWDPRSRLFSRT